VKIAVVLESPLSEIFLINGVSYAASFGTDEEFEKELEKISQKTEISLVIVPYPKQSIALKALPNKMVVGI